MIRTVVFDEKYYYEGTDLGAVYKKEETIFKVWAPTARLAKVRIYKSDKEYIDYEMYREENGVWIHTLQGDHDGARYTFLVCINLIWNEAVDPYAKSATDKWKIRRRYRFGKNECDKTSRIITITVNDRCHIV